MSLSNLSDLDSLPALDKYFIIGRLAFGLTSDATSVHTMLLYGSLGAR